MIWVDGRVVPDGALTVDARDRTFEHGLGLFETLRTWGGRPTLLPRHLERMRRSAAALGLPLNPARLPDAVAVSDLLAAEGLPGDVVLRITLTGGHAPAADSLLWMRASPLPPPTGQGGAVVSLGPWEVVPGDPLARHKTLNYWAKRIAFDAARAAGSDEVLGASPGLPCYWEGSRTNLFVVSRGLLVTPSLDGPVLPGVMRALVLELARGRGWAAREDPGVSMTSLAQADEVFLTNSVRGIIPVGRAVVHDGREPAPLTWPAPGPRTEEVMRLVSDWLDQPGGALA